LAGFGLKKIWRGGSLFLLGRPAEFRCFVMVFGGEVVVRLWFFCGGWEGDF
jgi:hypothetical protein